MEHTIRPCVSRTNPTEIGHFLRKFVSVEGHTLGELEIAPNASDLRPPSSCVTRACLPAQAESISDVPTASVSYPGASSRNSSSLSVKSIRGRLLPKTDFTDRGGQLANLLDGQRRKIVGVSGVVHAATIHRYIGVDNASSFASRIASPAI